MFRFLLTFVCLLSGLAPAFALTVKDLVQIQGEQENEISGQSLVIGLNGTGDKKNLLKDQMIQNWLQNSGLEVPQEVFQTKNVALVNVSGKLPAHAGKGQTIDLTVSTLGDAKSLKGGELVYTKLYYPGASGVQQTIYATASGPLMITEDQQETVGTVEGIVYTPVPSTVIRDGKMRLLLNKPDWVDSDRIARQINQHFADITNQTNTAKALSAGMIDVTIPEVFKTQPVGFIAQMKKIPVLFTDVVAKIIINSKTQMVMLNEKIEVSPFAFAYKDLNVVVGDAPKQAPNINSQFVQSVGSGNVEKTDLQNLIDALNAMRVQPRDLVEIIKYAHKLGAIQAELILE